MKKVSVIVPVYNREKFITRCIDSIVNQTMPHCDYELIIIDDCSTDNTYPILQDYQAKNPALIRLLRLEKNSGNASRPRNKGLDIAIGEYAFFVDSDDYIGEECLSRAYEYGSAHDADCVYVKFVWTKMASLSNCYTFGNVIRAEIMKHRLFENIGPTKFFKMSKIRELNLFFNTRYVKSEDELFLFTFLVNTEKISILSDYDYYHRDELSDGDARLSRAKWSINDFASQREQLFSSIYSGICDEEYSHQIAAAYLMKYPKAYISYAQTPNGLPLMHKLFTEFIPESVDKYVKKTYLLQYKAIRANDPVALDDAVNGGAERFLWKEWEKAHKYPPVKKQKYYDIALFGWHYNNNHGGALTFFALHELLKAAGFSVLVVHHRAAHPFIEPMMPNFNVTKNYYKLSNFRAANKLHELRNYVDTFVLASDQLWNIKFNSFWEWNYLGCGDETIKKIAVAGSFGHERHQYNDEQLPIATNLLARFDGISVRESSGVNILESMGIKGVEHILDPVFLCNLDTYNAMSGYATHKYDEKKALFAYILDANPSLIEFVKYIKQASECDIVYAITTLGHNVDLANKRVEQWASYDGLEFNGESSMADFIYNISRAEFVFTDSYHGACFSVIYHRPFICVRNDGRGAARYELFDKLGLSDRVIARQKLDTAHELIDKPIDWYEVDKRLNAFREHSFKWIENAFGRSFPRNYGVAGFNTVAKLAKSKCTGCGACSNACPKQCIVMSDDDEGFDYPVIGDACVDCGLCVQACPIIINKLKSDTQLPDADKRAYVGYSNDVELRFHSSSGGFFSELAISIFDNADNSTIFGAGFDTPYRVKHIGVNTKDGLSLIRQSKYVQSSIGDVYTQVYERIKTGYTAMFCGTPCQCAGLHHYLDLKGQNKEGLLSVDFICHSVNSPKAYNAYLEYIEQEYGKKIKSVLFRNKEQSWEKYSIRIDFECNDNYYLKNNSADLFYQGFLKYRLFSRPSCEECPFKGQNRFSDITLGDAWGVQLRNPNTSRDYGISVAIINTAKGVEWLERIRSRCIIEESDILSVSRGNRAYAISTKSGKYRGYFFDNLGKKPFSQIITDIGKAPALVKAPSTPIVISSPATVTKTALPVATESNKIKKYGNTIISAHPTAIIDVKGILTLNRNVLPESKQECIVKLAENAVLSVDGNYAFWYGTTVQLHKNAIFTIGNGGYCNTGTVIVCKNSITFGDGVTIARNCYIIDSDYLKILDDNDVISNPDAPIVIGNHVLVGEGCIILKGVTIGDGAVIAAHAVVNKDVPANTLFGGNPGKVIKTNIKWV